MKCPVCGNEVNHEEVFCGHCGTPNTPPTQSTNMTNAPSLRSGLGSTSFTPPPNTPDPGAQLSSLSGASSVPSTPNSQVAKSPQTGFYLDATEAISSIPNRVDQRYPMDYPQPGFPSSPPPDSYPGPDQLGAPRRPFPAGAYRGFGSSTYNTQQPLPTGMGYQYGTQGKLVPPLQHTQSNGMVILIVCISVVVVLIFGIGLSAFALTRGQNNGQPKAIATSAPTPTPAPTNTPMPTPSPTAIPTPVPDAGFVWCGPTCTSYGFSTEYPNNWQPGAQPATSATQFVDPAMLTISATFKTPPEATTNTAGALVDADLANFPGNTPLAAQTTSTISGETWVTSVVMYPNATTQQVMRVAVYATVHQGKAYIIELQAPNDQYDAIYAQFFASMLNKFQFSQAAQ